MTGALSKLVAECRRKSKFLQCSCFLKSFTQKLNAYFSELSWENSHWKKPVWFAKMLLGKVGVQDMMPRISMHADLSVRCTNHCVGATSVVLQKNSGFEDREVCFITGTQTQRVSAATPNQMKKWRRRWHLHWTPNLSARTALLWLFLSENTNEKETSDGAERTGWNSSQRRSTTPSPEILLSPATNTSAGIVFNAPNSSLHNVTINLGHRTNRSTSTLKRKHQEWHCFLRQLFLKRTKYCVVFHCFSKKG